MSILTISDTHGFFNETVEALSAGGLLEDKNNKVALLGDVLDRGPDAVRLTDYLIDLLDEGRLILIRGNHEDLIEDAILQIERGRIWEVATASHHVINGTFDSLLQLSGMSDREAVSYPKELVKRVKESPFFKKLLPACIDYYETDKYVLTHGWIPCQKIRYLQGRGAVLHQSEEYVIEPGYYHNTNWRNASPAEWRRARWVNGMELACKYGFIIPDKTVVCGHFHTSYGHSRIERACSEFGSDADFSPFYSTGIIAIDACVAHSGKINCVVLDD